MATPDHIDEIFEDTTEQVEVRGDYVHLTILSRFGEVILDCQMSADEAATLSYELACAAGTIDARNDPTPEQIADDWRDVADRAEVPNPTFSEAVDDLFADAAPRMAASA